MKQTHIRKTHIRKAYEERREEILRYAIKIAVKLGFYKFEKVDVSTAMDVNPALINHYFKSFKLLKKEVMRHAIKDMIEPILFEGIIEKDSMVVKLPAEIKKRILSRYIKQYT